MSRARTNRRRAARRSTCFTCRRRVSPLIYWDGLALCRDCYMIDSASDEVHKIMVDFSGMDFC